MGGPFVKSVTSGNRAVALFLQPPGCLDILPVHRVPEASCEMGVNHDHGRNVNTVIVIKEIPRPAKIKMSGKTKVSDADSGIFDTKAIMPARTAPAPVSAIPSPAVLATNGILFLGICAIW